VWFPPSSGIREEIDEVCRRHPDGFSRTSGIQEYMWTEAMDLAELQLRRYLIKQRVKRNLRAALLTRGMGNMNKIKVPS